MKPLNYISIAMVLFLQNHCSAQSWLPVGGGIGCVTGEYVLDLSQNLDSTKLLAAGLIFTDGECDTVCAVVSWNGSIYEPLAPCDIGVVSLNVFAFDDHIYCSGLLVSQDLVVNTNDFNVLQNGEWDTIPNGIRGTIHEVVEYDGSVYITGYFDHCGNTPCSLVCKFDGTDVVPVYIGEELAIGMSVGFYQDTLFVSGNFTHPNGDLPAGRNKCCKLVNGILETVGPGFDSFGMGTSLAEFQNKLYIAGSLREFGSNELHTIYYYENGQLHHLTEEPDALVYAIKAYNGGLYIAGDFHNIGSLPCEHVARWDGLEWTCLCNDPFYILDELPCESQCIKDIEIWNDTLYVAGVFNQIGQTETKRIAKLDMNLLEAFPTSIDVINAAPLKIYPNPTNGLITLSGPPSGVEFSVRICDSLGQLVFASNNSLQIDISSFSAGIYFLHYQDQNRCSTISFIKQF